MTAMCLLAAALAMPEAPPGAFTGKVYSSEGRPVAGAEVALYEMEASEARAERLMLGQARPTIASARTAADGTFRIEATLGVAQVQASAAGYAPQAVTVTVGETAELELKPAKPRKGTVRGNGGPVGGANLVWTGPEDQGGGFAELAVRTEGNGVFEVPDPDAWAGQAVILHRDFAVATAQPEGRAWPSPLRHELDTGSAVEGKVAAPRGAPAIGVVTLWLDGWPVGKAAADGTFRIPHAPLHWRTLVAKTARLFGVARPATAGRMTITLQPGRSITGVVRDSRTRAPVPGAVLTLMGQAMGGSLTAISDERGRYGFGPLGPERYWPSVVRTGYAPHGQAYDDKDAFDLRRSGAGTRDFVLTPLGRLTGRVQDAQQRPIADALVTFIPEGVPTIYSRGNLFAMEGGGTRTDPGGRFSLTYGPTDLEGKVDHTLDRPLLVLRDGYAATRLEGVEVGAGSRPLVVTLSRGIALTGRVLAEDGTPLTDVSVLIAEDAPVAGALMPAHALIARVPGEGWVKSDPDGAFTARVRPGLHDLSLRKDGYSPKVVPAHDPAAMLEVSLTPSVSLRGFVVSHDDKGVPDIAIHVAQPGGTSASTRTADDGSFALEELSAGPYELYAMKPGTGIKVTRRGEAPASDVRIELGRLGTLRGRVVDQRTGAPVTKFTAAASRGEDDDWEDRGDPQDVSDPAGLFLLKDLPLGDVSVTIQAEGYLRKEAAGVVSPGDEGGSPVEIAVEPGVVLHGRVTTTAGRPLADVSISASGGGEDPEASAESDEDGNYQLAGVRPGTVTLQFLRAGYVTLRKSFDTGDTTRTDAALARGLTLSGVVISGGAGVPRAQVAATSSAVEAQGAFATSAEGGAFSLDGLAPGRYTITASTEDQGEATLENVDAERSGPLRLVLERKPTAVLSGTVTGLPSGDAGLMVRVTASGEDGGSGQVPVDGRGAFRMEKAPVGRVRVQAFAASTSGFARTSRARELTLTPASEGQTVLEFPEDVVVGGRVTREGGPLAGAQVFFRAADASGGMASARANASGDYELMGVEPGPYTVTVSDTSFSFSTEYVVRESARFDIDATGSSVRGRTVDAADGSPVADVDVSFWREAETQPTTSEKANGSGEFYARSLREGRYRVLTSKKGYGQQVRELELQPGSSMEVVLELVAADGLSLTVVDARDDRALDATVVVRDLAKRVIANQHSGVGPDGMLTIPLAAGNYLLSTSATGYGTATVPVTAPGRGLRVGLTPGGTLVVDSERDLRGRIRLLKPDGEEYVRCWCNGIAAVQLTGRRTRVANVTAGTYAVELLDHTGAATRGPTVTIEEGQTATVNIE